MKISARLKHTADMVQKCNSIIDVGTDHAYIPIYLLEMGIAKSAIASDIKEGPLKVAEKNISRYGYLNQIETRLGPGLSTIKKGEVDTAIIAGMGGNMINDIILNDFKVATSLKNIIVQPVQYPEMTRKLVLEQGFSIIDEDIVKDENKFYFIMNLAYKKSEQYEKEAFYYTGKRLIEKKHPILLDYINFKINQLSDIKSGIDKIVQEKKYYELTSLIDEFETIKVKF